MSELYPDKPIYDIPALPICGAQELVDRLMQQIKPFEAGFHLGEETWKWRSRLSGRFRIVTSARYRIRCRRGGDRGRCGILSTAPTQRRRREGFEGSHLHYASRMRPDFTAANWSSLAAAIRRWTGGWRWRRKRRPCAGSSSGRISRAPASVRSMRDLAAGRQAASSEGWRKGCRATRGLLKERADEASDG